MPPAARSVLEGRLRLSRSPTADLAAGALEAQRAAGLEKADFIIVAVPAGTAPDRIDAIEAAAGD